MSEVQQNVYAELIANVYARQTNNRDQFKLLCANWNRISSEFREIPEFRGILIFIKNEVKLIISKRFFISENVTNNSNRKNGCELQTKRQVLGTNSDPHSRRVSVDFLIGHCCSSKYPISDWKTTIMMIKIISDTSKQYILSPDNISERSRQSGMS